jgi:arginyl-tRNA synthetase
MEDVIRTALTDILETLGISGVDFTVEHPGDINHGDYTANVALVAAKQLGQSPRAVAEQICAALVGQIEYVDRIEIAGPGFINFYLARDFFTAELGRVQAQRDAWGRGDSESGEVVLFEYTSPNLFKPLHIGNLVGNIVGESITRLFEMAGADVRRMNYPSDIGLTVAKGVWGLQKSAGNPDAILALGEAYRAGHDAYENDQAAKAEIIVINQALYAGSDATLSDLRARGIATSRASLATLCAKLGTTFDTEITESEASIPGTEIVNAHIGSVFTESNGAVVYEGEKVGLHTRVFLNSQGLPTYEAKDVGHFTLKTAAHPDWTQSIIVTANEQTEYFKVLYAALSELFPETKEKILEHIATGYLTLTTGKMSSRKGNVLTGESLFAEVEEAARVRATESRAEDIDQLSEELAVAAIKYQILRNSVGSNIVFDKDKALSFEGDSGPYLQYTHARILSVLEKAKLAGVIPSTAVVPESIYPVEQLLYRFPEVVAKALDERAPHKVVGYLTELAGSFNTFYANEKIADANDVYASYKAAVAEAVAITLKNGLWVLGIKAPERL